MSQGKHRASLNNVRSGKALRLDRETVLHIKSNVRAGFGAPSAACNTIANSRCDSTGGTFSLCSQ
jgi:hypothetical protein